MSGPPDATMPPRPLHALLAGLDAPQIIGDADCIVTDVAFDSRAVMPGGLFVALRGGYADGHRFIDDAAKRGAAAILVEEVMDVPPGIRAQVIVPDTRAALAVVAANWYEHPANDLVVIGITGTNGKTTTTTMTTAVLDAAGLSERLPRHGGDQTRPRAVAEPESSDNARIAPCAAFSPAGGRSGMQPRSFGGDLARPRHAPPRCAAGRCCRLHEPLARAPGIPQDLRRLSRRETDAFRAVECRPGAWRALGRRQ